ncbi:MAG TPA: hypothetical protein VMW13_10275, partial [Dehalococcoidales bacterium]|nr:hypothetical protein [Dehalococcoidales bacterium]
STSHRSGSPLLYQLSYTPVQPILVATGEYLCSQLWYWPPSHMSMPHPSDPFLPTAGRNQEKREQQFP